MPPPCLLRYQRSEWKKDILEENGGVLLLAAALSVDELLDILSRQKKLGVFGCLKKNGIQFRINLQILICSHKFTKLRIRERS